MANIIKPIIIFDGVEIYKTYASANAKILSYFASICNQAAQIREKYKECFLGNIFIVPSLQG